MRRPCDYYPTPAWVVDRLLDRVGYELPGGAWLEPYVFCQGVRFPPGASWHEHVDACRKSPG